MDGNCFEIILKKGNKSLELGKFTEYRLLEIEGIDHSDYEIKLSDNAQFDGKIVSNKRVNTRSISIKADYCGENKEAKRRELISFFNPKESGVMIVSYIGLQRSIEYEVEAFNSKFSNLYDEIIFSVDLICPNPFFSDLQQSREEIALWVKNTEFQLEIVSDGIELGYREPSLIVNVVNKGDVKTGMIIEFKAIGTLTNPSLFNLNTREYIKLKETTMYSGETILIDTNPGKKKVQRLLNGAITNLFNKIDLDSEFLQLEVGDNLFRYDADSNLENLEVKIYHSNQYLGV